MSSTIISTSEPENTIVQLPLDAVTREIVIADGSKDTSAVALSPHAGASSEAEVSSGIPSARMQRTHRSLSTESTHETTLADRSQSTHQELKP